MSKVILITGASSGIGKASAIYLAKQGYTVYAGVRKQGDIEKLKSEDLDLLIPTILDVSKPEDIDRAYKQIFEVARDSGLFALVNNAGVNYTAPFEVGEESEIRKLMEVNVFGPILLSQKFTSLLQTYKIKTGSNSHLINVGSIGSEVGLPWEYIYHVSKFAVYGFSKSVRIELDKLGIKVSCVMPGGIATDLFEKSINNLDSSFIKPGHQNEEYYKKAKQTVLNMAKSLEGQSLKPVEVAKLIHKILQKENPRLKNLIGLDARFIDFLVLYTPEWFSEWVLKSVAIPK